MKRIAPAWALLALAWLGAADADSEIRQVSVPGSGRVTAMPDEARVTLAVEARDTQLGTARRQVNDVSRRVLELAGRLGIPERQVQATGINLRPEYRWDKDAGAQRFVGYVVQRQLVVRVTDLERLGQLIEGAVDAGVNQVAPPVLDSSRRDALHREALAAAADDARAAAGVLADRLGVRLGPVLRIDAMDARGPPMPILARAMEMDSAGNGAATYQAGELSFDAQVNVVFELVVD